MEFEMCRQPLVFGLKANSVKQRTKSDSTAFRASLLAYCITESVSTNTRTRGKREVARNVGHCVGGAAVRKKNSSVTRKLKERRGIKELRRFCRAACG